MHGHIFQKHSRKNMLNNFLVLLDHALFIFNANVQKHEFKQNDRTLLARHVRCPI